MMLPRPERAAALAAALLIAAVCAHRPASAQVPPTASDLRAGEGRITGKVSDRQTGAPLEGVTVVLSFPAPREGGEAEQEFRVTDSAGEFVFTAVPAGRYRVEFLKSGYSAASLTELAVESGRESRADSPLEARASGEDQTSTSAASGPVETITVHGDQSKDLLGSIERRAQSDEMVNVLGAADFSKFAAVDLADALKRVAGVNVVEGQFAIIRGLEDRYSSTLYNGAPVPSPDPERQSVQLDLFPSEIVDHTVIAKNFAPELPSNSSGGSIDIATPSHPENPIELGVKAKIGINDNAYDRFIEFKKENPVGDEDKGFGALKKELGADLNGRTALHEREVRFKAVANYETDYVTEEGWKEGRQPANAGASAFFPKGDLALGELSLTDGRFDETTSTYSKQLTLYGGLGIDIDELGDHSIDASVFYTRKDTEKVRFRENGYLPGFDYAPVLDAFLQGNEIDAGLFDGAGPPFTPGQNASRNAWIAQGVGDTSAREDVVVGHPWFAGFYESRSFDISRDLQVYQLNGDHILEQWIDGLRANWAANYATTFQDETVLGARITYDPCGTYGNAGWNACPSGVTPLVDDPSRIPTRFPASLQQLGPGKFVIRRGVFGVGNAIDEDQYFGRFDLEYQVAPLGFLAGDVKSGLWYEHANRTVDSRFLRSDLLAINTTTCLPEDGCLTSGANTIYAVWGDTPQQVGSRIFSRALVRNPDGTFEAVDTTTNDSTREIQALHLDAKTTFWDDFDLLGGVRVENISIESKNDPFVGGTLSDGTPGSPQIFPSKYLLFDRLDNQTREGFSRTGPFNDQILNIHVPVGPCRDKVGNPIPGGGQCVDLINGTEIRSLVNGEIDENEVLPSAGINYRPFDWMTLRGAYSQSVARPSFREIGYYVSVASSAKTDELTVGNPQLQLSDVESWDARAEFVWGTFADLFAVSVFDKKIDDPIEQIVIHDDSNFDVNSPISTFRTFFNNPNRGKIQGIELEARKSLTLSTFDLTGVEIPNRDLFEFLDYLSIGGNYSYFDAEVKRSEFERARSEQFFRQPPDPNHALDKKRRLYGQPEWIANADISFDHPIWGTRVTLAYFAISDVLDAAGFGVPNQAPTGDALVSFTIDRYVDSYEQLDLVISQKLWRGFSVGFTAKNLTDSTRRIIYDPAQTSHRITEREYKRGRDYSLTVSWKF
jgi:TonB-dependent receptor